MDRVSIHRIGNYRDLRAFPGGRDDQWQISTGGGLYEIWSNDGQELFYETADSRIMVVDYRVNGDSFVPGKPHLWSEKQISTHARAPIT